VKETDGTELVTLYDFNFDGFETLRALIATSPYKTIAQAIASLTLFSHPDTVAQTQCKPVLRIIRNGARRGEIIELDGQRVGLDDNKAPTDVFRWCNGLTQRMRDVQFNHVYTDSQDPESYTCLANLCVTPSFLAKLTDTHPEVRAFLQFRVWQLYAWAPKSAPVQPEGYDDLEWAPCLPPVVNVRELFEAIAKRRVKDRTTMFKNALGAFV
jgi:hypothetical protein